MTNTKSTQNSKTSAAKATPKKGNNNMNKTEKPIRTTTDSDNDSTTHYYKKEAINFTIIGGYTPNKPLLTIKDNQVIIKKIPIKDPTDPNLDTYVSTICKHYQLIIKIDDQLYHNTYAIEVPDYDFSPIDNLVRNILSQFNKSVSRDTYLTPADWNKYISRYKEKLLAGTIQRSETWYPGAKDPVVKHFIQASYSKPEDTKHRDTYISDYEEEIPTMDI